MAKIVEMSTALANIIAAGEVVERPSNVLKEILENSIDAKAKNIVISVLEGGIKEIKVIDDGDGMDKEDLELCFKAHATSKIKNEYDLARVRTLGFRGEAIPSIAAVSKMSITSATNSNFGHTITYKFGKKIASSSSSHKIGTTVVVTDLFYNTPVRLKYLKSPERELASITYLVDKLALANPDISFKLYSEEKLLFQTNGTNDMPALLGEIYGLEAARRMVNVPFEEAGYSGNFYFIKPEIYRSNKLHMTYIVNGRYVKNNALNDMVIKAFDQFLPINKYPILVLYLTIDPLLIDVNVHPKKAEIRIADEQVVAQKLGHILRQALENTRQIPQREKPVKTDFQVDFSKIIGSTESLELEDKPVLREEVSGYNSLFTEDNLSLNEIYQPQIEQKKVENLPTKTQENQKLPALNYIGIIFKTYIVFENAEGMYLVDQHAAAERIKYEKFAELLSKPDQPSTSLLIPLTFDFTKDETLFLENHLLDFQKLGFNLSLIGENSFVLREVPLWAKNREIEDIVRDLLANMLNDQEVSILPYRDKIAKQISCKASIRANDMISKEEALVLIKELNECKNPYHCPHGRPTIIKFTKLELQKMFERVQN